MTNFEILQQMPLKSFANMVFEVTRCDCKSLEDFEAFLRKEIPNNLEENTIRTLHELQKLQRPKLKNFRTCELVEELKNREGVETHMAEPYGNVELEVDGPAIVLVVID